MSQVAEGQESASHVAPPSETAPIGNRVNEPIVRELRAMIEDPNFLPSKLEVLQILKTYFQGKVTIRPDNKDSRQDLA